MNTAGMASLVVGRLPTFLPLAMAFVSRSGDGVQRLHRSHDVCSYGFEDASARFVLHHSVHFLADTEVDASCKRITEAIFEHGHMVWSFVHAEMVFDCIVALQSVFVIL